MPHLPRPQFPARHPVHVTQRLQHRVSYLRTQSRARIIRDALRGLRSVRVIHYSIQGNHLHLILEAEGQPALSRAMQALATRIAKRLNALAGRRGAVFVDRYHARALATPREVGHAVRYVRRNYAHHARESLTPDWVDPFATSAETPFAAPSVWLLRVGWRVQSPRRGLAERSGKAGSRLEKADIRRARTATAAAPHAVPPPAQRTPSPSAPT